MNRPWRWEYVWLGMGLCLGLATGLGWLGRWHWLLDLFSHFNAYYLVGLAICLGGLWLRPSRLPVWPTLVLLPPLLVNLALFWPFYMGTAVAAPANAPSLRVANLNVYARNDDYTAIADYIRHHQPHVVFISEIEPALMAYLQQELGDSYPYVYDEAARGTVGLAFFSQRPLQTAETIPYNHPNLPSHGHWGRRQFITATIEWEGQPIALYALHPYPPLGGRMAAMRDAEIAAVSALLAEPSEMPIILLGDFNATPWSAPMRQLTAETGLRYASRGFGLRPTWLGMGGLVRVPIDHILLSPHWQVSHYTTAGDIGSDHRPVSAVLHLAP